MRRGDRIYVAGHTGLVGSAILRALRNHGFENLILRRSSELDLRDPAATLNFFRRERPRYVFLAAAKVGGILANSEYPADFIDDNLAIEYSVIRAAHEEGVEKLLFLGSSCIYPKHAPQPLKEEHLLTGPLEPTNRSYAIAKIAGLEMCRAHWEQYGDRFVCAMPTNVYGPGDNFDLETSHVVAALLRKFHEAKVQKKESVTIWGTGIPKREFIYADDLADGLLFLMEHYDSPEFINVGVGEDVSILELAQLISDVVGFGGRIEHDLSKPDGTPRKLLDVSALTALGWTASTALRDGVRQTYDWYLQHWAERAS